MYKYILAKKMVFSLLVLVLLVLAFYINNSRGKEAETLLVNPTRIQSYGDCAYFLDALYQDDTYLGQTIKKYKNGKIYNATPWISRSHFEQHHIIGFAVISENKFIILTDKLPEKAIIRLEDVPSTTEYFLYLLDGNTKKTTQITTLKRTYGIDPRIFAQACFDVDEENNIYITFNELIKITPEGKSIVLTDLDMLPPDVSKDTTGFYRISVGPHSIFAILGKEGFEENVVIELDKHGKFIKSYDLFEKSQFGINSPRFLKYADGAIFIRTYTKLYRYNLETELLEIVFDEPLDSVHHWIVFDLARTNNGYLLLVTNTDTENPVDVWKLTDDGTLLENFIYTKKSD